MKNLVPFPKRSPGIDPAEDLRATVALLREVVGQLAERIEVLEARAALGAASVPVKLSTEPL
jgi:hypothetical protein